MRSEAYIPAVFAFEEFLVYYRVNHVSAFFSNFQSRHINSVCLQKSVITKMTRDYLSVILYINGKSLQHLQNKRKLNVFS